MITLCDVAPRDGLQNEAASLPPETRAELVQRLADAGLKRVEVVSFVSDERVPQMSGAEAVVAAIQRHEDVSYAGLVLNETGYDRLSRTSLDAVHAVVIATDTFSLRNANRSTADGLSEVKAIVARAQEDGRRATVTISAAFGCPFEGAVEPDRVIGLAAAIVDAGADELMLADTIGVAVPRQVRELVACCHELGVRVGVHLHDTRNTAIVNAYAALEAGATIFDASVGGIGGCPFAPRATGNVCTADLVHLFKGEGFDLGVDLDALIEIARWLEQLLGHPLEGHLHRAGPGGAAHAAAAAPGRASPS